MITARQAHDNSVKRRPASSSIGKVDIQDLAFLNELSPGENDYTSQYLHFDPYLRYIEDVKLYDLTDLAKSVRCDVSGWKDSEYEDAAKAIIEYIFKDVPNKSDYNCTKQDQFCIKGESADCLPRLFISQKNRGDISFCKINPSKSMIVHVEVHSSPFASTIKKCILGLVELLRLLKAHGCSAPKLTAFAFPRFGVKTCVVSVSMEYYPTEFSFDYQLTCLDPYKVKEEMLNAFSENLKVISSLGTFNEEAKSYQVYLTDDNLGQGTFGMSPKQMKCSYGLLIESKKDGVSYCYKKPTYKTQTTNLFFVKENQCNNNQILHMVTYSFLNSSRFFLYKKLHYDPLQDDEAVRCLKDLVEKVKEAVEELNGLGLQHNDLRLPNICFNEQFTLVLIDLDLATNKRPGANEDLKRFGREVEGILGERGVDLCNDKFVVTLKKGKFDEDAMSTSIVAYFNKQTIRDVLSKRQ